MVDHPAIRALLIAVQRVDEIANADAKGDGIEAALNLPEAYAARVRGIRVIPGSGREIPDPDVAKAAQGVIVELGEKYRATGEAERDLRLSALAAELATIVVSLPRLVTVAGAEVAAMRTPARSRIGSI